MFSPEPALLERLQRFRNEYPASAWLVEGFEQIPRESQIESLVGTFLLTEFRWSGKPTSKEDFLRAGGACVGDCGSISGAFLLALQALGFDDAVANHYPGPLFVRGGGLLTGGGEGNIDGTTDWYFDDHHTVTVGGREYDLLFRGKVGTPVFSVGKFDEVDANGTKIGRWTFRDVVLYEGRADDQAHRYTRSWDTACELVGVNAKYISALTKAPERTKPSKWDAIGDKDESVRRQGVLDYVKEAGVPDKDQDWVVNYIIANVALPIADMEDGPITAIVGGFTGRFGDLDEAKWNEFAKAHKPSIFAKKPN